MWSVVEFVLAFIGFVTIIRLFYLGLCAIVDVYKDKKRRYENLMNDVEELKRLQDRIAIKITTLEEKHSKIESRIIITTPISGLEV